MQGVQQGKGQGGFTLIELIAVLVILGVLAAVAVPKFMDFQEEAEIASVNAQAANIAAASTQNAANAQLDQVGAFNPAEPEPVTVASCDDVENLWDDGDFMDALDTTSFAISGDQDSFDNNDNIGKFTIQEVDEVDSDLEVTGDTQDCYVILAEDD